MADTVVRLGPSAWLDGSTGHDYTQGGAHDPRQCRACLLEVVDELSRVNDQLRAFARSVVNGLKRELDTAEQLVQAADVALAQIRPAGGTRETALHGVFWCVSVSVNIWNPVITPNSVLFDTWDEAAAAIQRALAIEPPSEDDEPNITVIVSREKRRPSEISADDTDLVDWPAPRHITWREREA